MLHVTVWEGRREGSALLKNGSLVPARCITLHKHCATKLCLPTVANFKRVQPRLCAAVWAASLVQLRRCKVAIKHTRASCGTHRRTPLILRITCFACVRKGRGRA